MSWNAPHRDSPRNSIRKKVQGECEHPYFSLVKFSGFSSGWGPGAIEAESIVCLLHADDREREGGFPTGLENSFGRMSKVFTGSVVK